MTENTNEFRIENFLNKKIRVVFIDGKAVVGKLIDVNRYELYLQLPKGKKLLCIFKHSVKYITEETSEEA